MVLYKELDRTSNFNRPHVIFIRTNITEGKRWVREK